MDLFFGGPIASHAAAAWSWDTRADFQQTFLGLAAENKALWDELTSGDRYRAAMKKIEERAKSKQ